MRIYIRNKQRYDPSAKGRDLLHVDVQDYATTSIRDIKEHCKRATKMVIKLDQLFYNNQPLADDRSVGHYNIPEGSILEATSNPFFAAAILVLKCHADLEREAKPYDRKTQDWTKLCITRKIAILAILYNSKKDRGDKQPEHFKTVHEFIMFLEALHNKGKKGVQMSRFTIDALHRHMEEYLTLDVPHHWDHIGHFVHLNLVIHMEEYLTLDVPHHWDHIGHFVHRNAVKLGYRRDDKYLPGDDPGAGGDAVLPSTGNGAHQNNTVGNIPAAQDQGQAKAQGQRKNRGQKAKTKARLCEDCEEQVAEFYCAECENPSDGRGLVLCQACREILHRGAARRRHVIQDVSEAPKQTKSYVPHAYKAPFAMLAGLYSGLNEEPVKLSMTEDELKQRAQPLTDTDLSDKQQGRWFGGFDSMEHTLLTKGLIQKEAAANPTYTLTESGRQLGSKLLQFHNTMTEFLRLSQVPSLPQTDSVVIGTRRVCLIVDEHERERDRLVDFAMAANVPVQVRSLPTGDYLWILTPPTQPEAPMEYKRVAPDVETVLPYVVERKSWDDLRDSMDTTRFRNQVLNMKRSGIHNKFYLVEGFLGDMKNRVTVAQKSRMQEALSSLQLDEGFFVNFTGSWLKTAQWLLQLTYLAAQAHRQGQRGKLMTYREFTERVNGRNNFYYDEESNTGQRRVHTWTAGHFTQTLFRDRHGEQTVVEAAKEDIGLTPNVTKRGQHLLIIEGLENYNKDRQKHLNKCLQAALKSELPRVDDLVETHLGGSVGQLIHYDITCYWQLHLQMLLGVGIYRTENPEETERIRTTFLEGPQENNNNNNVYGRAIPTSRGGNKGKKRTPTASAGRARDLPVGASPVKKDQNRQLSNHRRGKPGTDGDEERGHESYWDKLPDGNVLQDPVERTMGGAGDAGMDPTIFAQDSQSEEDMIQQAMAESLAAAEVKGQTDEVRGQINTLDAADSQDEDLKGAIEMSLRDAGQQQPSLKNNSGTSQHWRSANEYGKDGRPSLGSSTKHARTRNQSTKSSPVLKPRESTVEMGKDQRREHLISRGESSSTACRTTSAARPGGSAPLCVTPSAAETNAGNSIGRNYSHRSSQQETEAYSRRNLFESDPNETSRRNNDRHRPLPDKNQSSIVIRDLNAPGLYIPVSEKEDSCLYGKRCTPSPSASNSKSSLSRNCGKSANGSLSSSVMVSDTCHDHCELAVDLTEDSQEISYEDQAIATIIDSRDSTLEEDQLNIIPETIRDSRESSFREDVPDVVPETILDSQDASLEEVQCDVIPETIIDSQDLTIDGDVSVVAQDTPIEIIDSQEDEEEDDDEDTRSRPNLNKVSGNVPNSDDIPEHIMNTAQTKGAISSSTVSTLRGDRKPISKTQLPYGGPAWDNSKAGASLVHENETHVGYDADLERAIALSQNEAMSPNRARMQAESSPSAAKDNTSKQYTKGSSTVALDEEHDSSMDDELKRAKYNTSKQSTKESSAIALDEEHDSSMDDELKRAKYNTSKYSTKGSSTIALDEEHDSSMDDELKRAIELSLLGASESHKKTVGSDLHKNPECESRHAKRGRDGSLESNSNGLVPVSCKDTQSLCVKSIREHTVADRTQGSVEFIKQQQCLLEKYQLKEQKHPPTSPSPREGSSSDLDTDGKNAFVTQQHVLLDKYQLKQQALGQEENRPLQTSDHVDSSRDSRINLDVEDGGQEDSQELPDLIPHRNKSDCRNFVDLHTNNDLEISKAISGRDKRHSQEKRTTPAVSERTSPKDSEPYVSNENYNQHGIYDSQELPDLDLHREYRNLDTTNDLEIAKALQEKYQMKQQANDRQENQHQQSYGERRPFTGSADDDENDVPYDSQELPDLDPPSANREFTKIVDLDTTNDLEIAKALQDQINRQSRIPVNTEDDDMCLAREMHKELINEARNTLQEDERLARSLQEALTEEQVSSMSRTPSRTKSQPPTAVRTPSKTTGVAAAAVTRPAVGASLADHFRAEFTGQQRVDTPRTPESRKRRHSATFGCQSPAKQSSTKQGSTKQIEEYKRLQQERFLVSSGRSATSSFRPGVSSSQGVSTPASQTPRSRVHTPRAGGSSGAATWRADPATPKSSSSSKISSSGIKGGSIDLNDDDDDDGDLPVVGIGSQNNRPATGIRSPAKAAGGQAGVTCGACKNKGHSRTSKQCSLYYSDGETARREEQQERRRRKAEEALRAQQEALTMLTGSRDAVQQDRQRIMAQIEALQRQIQEQYDPLQQRLQEAAEQVEKTIKKKKK